jgi:hypothetical protein
MQQMPTYHAKNSFFILIAKKTHLMDFVILSRRHELLEMQTFRDNANFKLSLVLSFCLHTKVTKERANILGLLKKKTPFHYKPDFIAADNLQQTNKYFF